MPPKKQYPAVPILLTPIPSNSNKPKPGNSIITFLDSVQSIQQNSLQIWLSNHELQCALSQQDFATMLNIHLAIGKPLQVSGNFLVATKKKFDLPRLMSIFCDPAGNFALIIHFRSQLADGKKEVPRNLQKMSSACLAFIITPSGKPDLVWLHETIMSVQLAEQMFQLLSKFRSPFIIRAALLKQKTKMSIITEEGIENLGHDLLIYKVHDVFIMCYSILKALALVHHAGVIHDNTVLANWELFFTTTDRGLPLYFAKLTAWENAYTSSNPKSINQDLANVGDTIVACLLSELSSVKKCDQEYRKCSVEVTKLIDEAFHAITDLARLLVTCAPMSKRIISSNTALCIFLDIIQPLRAQYPPFGNRLSYLETLEKLQFSELNTTTASSNLRVKSLTQRDEIETVLSPKLDKPHVPFSINIYEIHDALHSQDSASIDKSCDEAPVLDHSWNPLQCAIYDENWQEAKKLLLAKSAGGHLTFNYKKHNCGLLNFALEVDTENSTPLHLEVMKLLVKQEDATFASTLRGTPLASIVRNFSHLKIINHITWEIVVAVLEQASLQKIAEKNNIHLLLAMQQWQQLILVAVLAKQWGIVHSILNFCANDTKNFPKILASNCLQQVLREACISIDIQPLSVLNLLMQLGSRHSCYSFKPWVKLAETILFESIHCNNILAIQLLYKKRPELFFNAKHPQTQLSAIFFAMSKQRYEIATWLTYVTKFQWSHYKPESNEGQLIANYSQYMQQGSHSNASISLASILNPYILRLLEDNNVTALRNILVTNKLLSAQVTVLNKSYPIINYAAKKGKWEMVRMLIEARADVNQVIHYSNGSHCNLLHLVVQNQNVETLICLLRRSDLNFYAKSHSHDNRQNETAIEIAKRLQNNKLLQLLTHYESGKHPGPGNSKKRKQPATQFLQSQNNSFFKKPAKIKSSDVIPSAVRVLPQAGGN